MGGVVCSSGCSNLVSGQYQHSVTVDSPPTEDHGTDQRKIFQLGRLKIIGSSGENNSQLNRRKEINCLGSSFVYSRKSPRVLKP